MAGAEAQHSAKAHAGGVAPHPEHTGDTVEGGALAPDPVVGDDRVGIGGGEMSVGLVAPVHVYALFESAIAHRAGRTGAQQRTVLGELMAPFTEVAATQPVAWFRDVRTPSELATVTADNRLVAEPYPKRMCAFLHVNQGAAALVTSLAAARAAGVADMAVFCWSGADAAEVWFPSARPDLATSAGLHAATAAALSAADLDVDDIGAFDLYSCFPCAVEMAAEALGIAPDDTRGLTTTGGLPYFGGPGNNYSLHGVASTVYRIRAHGGTGLVSAMGWYATKHAVGIYGATPPPKGWRHGDTDTAQRVIDASAVPVAAEAESDAVVVAATAVTGRGGTVTAAPAIARLPDGRQIAAGRGPRRARGTGRGRAGRTSHRDIGHPAPVPAGDLRPIPPRPPAGWRGRAGPVKLRAQPEQGAAMSAVERERRGHVEILTINRPEARNAINGDVSVAHGGSVRRARDRRRRAGSSSSPAPETRPSRPAWT